MSPLGTGPDPTLSQLKSVLQDVVCPALRAMCYGDANPLRSPGQNLPCPFRKDHSVLQHKELAACSRMPSHLHAPQHIPGRTAARSDRGWLRLRDHAQLEGQKSWFSLVLSFFVPLFGVCSGWHYHEPRHLHCVVFETCSNQPPLPDVEAFDVDVNSDCLCGRCVQCNAWDWQLVGREEVKDNPQARSSL